MGNLVEINTQQMLLQASITIGHWVHDAEKHGFKTNEEKLRFAELCQRDFKCVIYTSAAEKLTKAIEDIRDAIYESKKD